MLKLVSMLPVVADKEDLYVVAAIHMVRVGQASLIGIMANFLGDTGFPSGILLVGEHARLIFDSRKLLLPAGCLLFGI